MHHYGRLKAVCLGTPADGGGWTIWNRRLGDNDAYCMSKCVDTGVDPCCRAKYEVIGKSGMWLIQQAPFHPLWYVIFEIYMKLLVGRSLSYWSVVVGSNRCWLREKQPLSLLFNPLSAALYGFVLLFKPSSCWKCDSVYCHLSLSLHFRRWQSSYVEHSAPHVGISDRSASKR